MTQKPTRSPRAALLIGAALLATPAFAQDTQTVAPPPVVSTVPQAAPAPAPAPAPATTFAPSAPVVQAVPDVPTPQTPPHATARPATRTTTTSTRQTTRTTAPAAAAPAVAVPAAQPAAPAAQPVEQPAPVAATPPETTPAAPVQADTTTTTTTKEATPRQNALWPWLLGGALIVAGIIAALLFRRRTEYDEVYEEAYEPAYAEPAAVTDPIFAPKHEPEVAPVIAPMVTQEELAEPVTIAEDAEIVKADSDDVADLTAAAPHSKRPWLEFGMRPVRAGTSSDEAMVDIELTVANSGDMPANNVRISAFLLKEGEAGDMERLLTEHETSVPPVTIGAGEGTRVDATLALRKDEVQANGANFSPVVVADARYTMADGTEGRTSATFRVGLWNDGEGIEPIGIGRPQMHDNVAAELEGVPEHA
jgi:hypothetical protein